MINFLLISTVLTFLYQFKVTGTETTRIPLPSYSRFFCRTLCDFQAAALSCSELVLILPQMAIVIKGT